MSSRASNASEGSPLERRQGMMLGVWKPLATQVLGVTTIGLMSTRARQARTHSVRPEAR